MRAVFQRVTRGKVSVGDETIGEIKNGVVVLLGVGNNDHWADAEYIIRKILQCRMWSDLKDPEKSWTSSVVDNDYEILMVSQFTLFGTLKKGNKPDFHAAVQNTEALETFNKVVEELRQKYKPEKVKTGAFGQHMKVEIENDGPVTLIIDTAEMQLKRTPAPRKPQGGAKVSAASSPGKKLVSESPSESPVEGSSDSFIDTGGCAKIKRPDETESSETA